MDGRSAGVGGSATWAESIAPWSEVKLTKQGDPRHRGEIGRSAVKTAAIRHDHISRPRFHLMVASLTARVPRVGQVGHEEGAVGVR